jgi:hypothetical protein
MSASDLLHFTAATHFTVGYGDIYPVSAPARAAAARHMVACLVALL